MGKYLPDLFVHTERRWSEVCAKNRTQILPSMGPADEVDKEFIIWLLDSFLFHF